MKFSLDSTLHDILSSEHGRAVLEKHIPAITKYPYSGNVSWTLRYVDQDGDMALIRKAIGWDETRLKAILVDLTRPVQEVTDGRIHPESMDVLDRQSFGPGPAPFDSEPVVISLAKVNAASMPAAGMPPAHPSSPPTLSLDGQWQLAESGEESLRLSAPWVDAFPCSVPGSVHTALVAAGRIPDPTFGVNQKIARLESFKTWWMKRTFPRPVGMNAARLVLGGVCNRCTIWLNGHLLGSHEGMFGGPEFDVTSALQDDNELVVKLDPVPFEPVDPNSDYPENNRSWRKTVVFNNVYGWHYSNLQPLGIWRSVELHAEPAVAMEHPFIATRDARAGLVELAIQFRSKFSGWSGTLKGSVSPANFSGEAYGFEMQIASSDLSKDLHLRFPIPDAHLWWPVDLGAPDLYRLQLSFTPDGNVPGGDVSTGDALPDVKKLVFGIRTVEMAPFPEGPRPDKYNWTFMINGTPHFNKGSGWCTMDPLMDFSLPRYDRFLSLAMAQHVQMLRGWGSGMPETDEFYDLCDQKGIMVLQEWPTAWNSHLEQPYAMLEETVRLNTLRLRNHPSLVMWGSGNESPMPFGEAIDMMGRLSVELDGTRPFHRGEPWGGSQHDYTCYWGRQHLDYNVNMTADFYGEYGLACMPPYESVQRYLPDEEKQLWPPKKDGALVYHTPIFGHAEDLSRITQYARYFVSGDCSMEEFTVGSQLSQAVGVRHPLERARTRWPECTGALYYKMNDNFPAASWSCVDWYGAPKMGYYFFQDAFAPLHACILLPCLNFAGTPVQLPTFLLDDANALNRSNWKVTVRACNSLLHEVRRVVFAGQGAVQSPLRLGDFTLSFEETDSTPLFVVAEVLQEGSLVDRTFYWMNYEAIKGCLFHLPRTRLDWTVDGNQVTVKNIGSLAAVAVNVTSPGHLDSFTVSDNYFWLDPGETRTVEVNSTARLSVSAWNAS